VEVNEEQVPALDLAINCPKCEASIEINPVTPATSLAADATAGFERPASAPRFNRRAADKIDESSNSEAPTLNDLAKLLALAIKDTEKKPNGERLRSDQRKLLVCASPAYREAIAESLIKEDYDVFVAENLAQALGRMREDRMDIVVLDANFDPLEQGVAFITREVRQLRPAQRRRLFFIYITSNARTMDLHAAFLHNVNLVVNPSDIEQLPEALGVSLRHYNELYAPWNRALDVAAI
jgi:CheY-like chemotaxis protein